MTILYPDLRHILFIGMPVADVLVPSSLSASIIHDYHINPGGRTMLNATQTESIEALLEASGEYAVVAGGSLANTACIVAQLCQHCDASFFAAIAEDYYGMVFHQALKQAGLTHIPTPYRGEQSSRSYMVLDEQGERGFGRYLGDSMDNLTADTKALDEAIAKADLVILEGELAALEGGYELWRHILHKTQAAGKCIGFSLFGAEQVQQHTALFWETLAHYTDMVFGNEAELAALFADEGLSHDAACRQLGDLLFQRNADAVLCVSQGSATSTLITGSGRFHVSPRKVTHLVNTSGAGDAFMGGVLSGILNGLDGHQVLELGHEMAALVIQQEEPQLSAAQLEKYQT